MPVTSDVDLLIFTSRMEPTTCRRSGSGEGCAGAGEGQPRLGETCLPPPHLEERASTAAGVHRKARSVLASVRNLLAKACWTMLCCTAGTWMGMARPGSPGRPAGRR